MPETITYKFKGGICSVSVKGQKITLIVRRRAGDRHHGSVELGLNDTEELRRLLLEAGVEAKANKGVIHKPVHRKVDTKDLAES